LLQRSTCEPRRLLNLEIDRSLCVQVENFQSNRHPAHEERTTTQVGGVHFQAVWVQITPLCWGAKATGGLTFKIIYGTIVWGVIGVLGVQGLQRSAQPQTKVADAQPVTDAKSYITIDSSWSSLKTKGRVIGGWTRVHWSGGTPLTSPNNFALLCTDRDDCFKLPKGGTFEARLVDNPNLKYTGDLTLEVDLKDGKLGRYQVSKLDDSELQVDEEVISPDRHYLLFKVHWADGADAGQSFHLYCNRFLPDCRSLNVHSYYMETLATDDETTYQDLSYKIYNRQSPKDFGVYGSGMLGSVTRTPQED
jgi:hypothetical protein